MTLYVCKWLHIVQTYPTRTRTWQRVRSTCPSSSCSVYPSSLPSSSISLSLFLYVWLFLIPQCDSWIPQVCPYTRVYRGERITSYRCAARGEQNASIARKRELTRFPGEPVPQFRRQRALSARVTLAPAAISPLILRRRSCWQTVASDRNWNWL